MSIAVIIENDGDAKRMVGWGSRFARCFEVPLLVIHATRADEASLDAVPLQSDTEPLSGMAAKVLEAWQAASLGQDPAGQHRPTERGVPSEDAANPTSAESAATSHGEPLHPSPLHPSPLHPSPLHPSPLHPSPSAESEEDEDHAPPVDVSFFRVRDPKAATGVMTHLSDWGVDLLLLPMDASKETTQLFQMAPCPTMLLRATAAPDDHGCSVVVPTAGHRHDHEALRLAAKLGACEDREVTALYVEQDIGDVSSLVGHRAAKRYLSLALLDSGANVKPATVVHNKVDQGVKAAIAESDCGMVLLGTRSTRIGAQPYGQVIARILKAVDDLPVGILRPALPLHRRFLHRTEMWLEDRLPQMTRDERVRLVGRIQEGSDFNVDFGALICLSTLIAALGLARNQGAVVIGAMLVAPLMTPIMGFGLALMQGNSSLARQSAKTVLFGFALALFTAVLVGLLIIDLKPSTEMLGRGSPGVLDLLVAFVSGMAAAYAIGRPGLAAALPGVAIAAALVPPIATAGMGIAIGQGALAGGALILFLTNIVAIALGSAVGLWAVGVRSQHQHGGYESWSGWVITGLVLTTIALAVYESQPTVSFADMPHTLEQDLQRIVDGHMADARVRLDDSTVHSESGHIEAVLRLESSSLPPDDLAEALRSEMAKHVGTPVNIRLKTEFTQTASAPVE